MSSAVAEIKEKRAVRSQPAAETPLSAEELRKMHAYWRAQTTCPSAKST